MILRWYWLCVGRRWCDVAAFFAVAAKDFVYLLTGGQIASSCWKNCDYRPGIFYNWFKATCFLGHVSYRIVNWILGGNFALHLAEEWELAGGLEEYRASQEN